MARRIIWSHEAQQERRSILYYWEERTRSKTFSRKLNRLFNERLNQARQFPEMGLKTDFPSVYILVIREYLVFYRVTDLTLTVLTLWDGRRNPDEKPFR